MTRHPKSGKGRKWTIKELEAIPAAWKGDNLSDGDGLTGTVRASADGAVSIHFKSAFKWDGKVAWQYCGTWPSSSLESIRVERDTARNLVREGIDPRAQRKAARIENQAKVEAVIANKVKQDAANRTLQQMFDAWLADGVNRKDGNAELLRSFEKDVLPILGPLPVRDITEHELRNTLRTVIQRGVNRMAVRLYNDLVQLFNWAERRQPWRGLMLEGNPAELVEITKLLPNEYDMNSERERTLSPDELRELRSIFERMHADYDTAANKRSSVRPLRLESQSALWISLGTTCRIGELLMAEWAHVDLEKGEWFIPKANVKGTTGKKQDQLVFLSAFALRHFKILHGRTGDTPWCFPARNSESHVCVKTVSKQIGDRQSRFKSRKPLKNRRHDDTLVLAGGKNGEWTPHDMRRTAATIMQSLRVALDVIDRCQNHVIKGSRVRRHYLHHDYAEEKQQAWQLLGERLDEILNLDNLPSPEASKRKSTA